MAEATPTREPTSTDATPTAALRSSRFLRACRGEANDRPPLWVMRQAGRYLPEYREVRKRAGSFLTLCHTPELATEVTLQPIRRFGLDAAILFSDILIPAEAMGFEVTFQAGEGPRIQNPFRGAQDLARIRCPEPEEACAEVFTAIRMICDALGPVPLLSFAAAPFTLACYLIEGRTSKDYRTARALLHDPDGPGAELLAAIERYSAKHLIAGIRAGASAVQIFESWGDLLGPKAFDAFSVGPTRRVVEAVRAAVGDDVPIIFFARTRHIDRMRGTGASVLGLDWRTDLRTASRMVGEGVALQGNLDPSLLLTTPALIASHALEVLEAGDAHPGGHIMNLGHGITPDVPVAHMEALVEAVFAFESRRGEGVA